jgi:hypothetical protein
MAFEELYVPWKNLAAYTKVFQTFSPNRPLLWKAGSWSSHIYYTNTSPWTPGILLAIIQKNPFNNMMRTHKHFVFQKKKNKTKLTSFMHLAATSSIIK